VRAPKAICVDFETEGIQARPKYPPKPCSIGIKWPDQSTYKIMAWGHPSGNNCTEREARGELKRAYDSKYPILAQNFAFDGDVAETHWQLALPSWDRYHELMFILFLHDPHSPTLALKPCAERYLGIAPEEQDRVYEWVIANVPEAKKKPSTAGAYICRCPFKIAAPYLRGDLTRTIKLYEYLYPKIIDVGMGEAYDRERKLLPVLLENARVGMRVDVEKLSTDVVAMKLGIEKSEGWLHKRLGDININSDKQLAEALLSKGIVQNLALTPKGQYSVSKKTLTPDKFKDKRVWQVLSYHSKMETCVNMFAEAWLSLAGATGSMHPNWSQVRSPKGSSDDTNGARSGRIICTKPNFLNVSKKFSKDISAGYTHPEFLGTLELPRMRTYCLPDEKEVWGRRDFNQEELRLFAHFEDADVMRGFLADAKYDIHELVRVEVERALQEAGLRASFDRDSAKTINFGRLYGQGLTGLMINLKLLEEERPVGKVIQNALNRAVPSIKEVDKALKALADLGQPIRTIGGRLYYCEPPQYSEKFGRNMTFEYKLLNYLCQGSGADVTKEALVKYHAHHKRRGRILVSVYDEIDFSCPKGALREEMKILRECMLNSIPCDVPLLSDGEWGPNWGTLAAWKD